MAGIDLYGNDAGAIRNAYKSSLRRDASDDEVSGWLSGSYGGGGVNDWINQIANSGEAQQYKQPSAPAPTDSPVVGQTPNVSTPQGDPWAQARQGLTDTYQQFVGRAPGEGDIDKWLSGGYGYGSGLQDYDKFVAAIMGSPEARAYRPQNTSTNGYQNLDYWQSQGVPGIDIFDPMTGQLRGGWSRTAQGYSRTGGAPTTPNVAGPQGGNFESWFSQLTGGKPPTPEELERLAPVLSQYGIKIGSKGNRGWSDTIILPDGRTFDVIEGAGIGSGKRWTWQQNGGPGYVPTAPEGQYNDPYTNFLAQLLSGRIGSLMQPVNDPNRNAYEAMLKQRAASLGSADSELAKLITHLESRFNDLQGPGYTGAENEAIRTGALDPIEQDRAAAKKRVIEQLSRRGLNLESGISQQALQEVDKAFDAMRGTSQTALTMNDLNRREGRQQRADTIRTTLADIPQQRAREQLDVFQAINQLSLLARQEDEARQREAVGYGGALSDLGPQRLQLAMQAAGMGGNPSSMFQNLMQLAGMNQNASLYGAQNQSSLWSGLGSMAAMLANAGR